MQLIWYTGNVQSDKRTNFFYCFLFLKDHFSLEAIA